MGNSFGLLCHCPNFRDGKAAERAGKPEDLPGCRREINAANVSRSGVVDKKRAILKPMCMAFEDFFSGGEP
jgi:hypothetical protein